MREIHSTLIVGAGAIGAAVASRIFDIDKAAVALCATGERRERYIREGFIVNGRRYFFPLADPTPRKPYDLVIVAVKSYHLALAIEEMRPYVAPGTIIISLLNGIASEEILRAEFRTASIPLAVIISIDALRVGNRIDFESAGEIRFGLEKNDPKALDDDVAAVARFFARHGVQYSIPENMVKALWFKFMINVAMNQWSALLRGSYLFFQKSASARELVAATMREVIALSDALGKGLVQEDVATVFATTDRLNGNGRTSMLQDVDALRKTEVDIFAGVIVQKARECGVPVPINEFLLLSIKAIEEGYGL
ncbi:MAG: ketopantoate reductase family protein [Rectinemataceae bacterium]